MSDNNLYQEPDVNVSLPKLEKEIIKYWTENKIFEKSVNDRPSKNIKIKPEFVFYDGPPFANGLPHYGHLLTGFIKDSYARYHTAKGQKVERCFGWDCHGLPAEMSAEKELGVSGRGEIQKYGIAEFNDHCKKSVMKYSTLWEEYIIAQGRWVDFKNSYKTMDINYMESVIWVFKELYKKGLIYQSKRVMPYSFACQTPLSNFETRLDNSYRPRNDKAVTVAFELVNRPDFINEDYKKCFLLAWTTTPWTLPSNLALAVDSKLEYSVIKNNENYYILAKFVSTAYKKELGDEVYTKILGIDLVSLKYKPVFDYFKNHANSFCVLEADFIEEGEGTGIVHMAPGFGEDDQILCQKAGIELVCPVDDAGKFTKDIKDLEGINVFDANDKVIIKLKNQGNWIRTEQYIHNYPHCWRTDTPLIYKAVSSWYVKVSDFKDKMIELNQKINWIPESTKNGLFGKWLEGARDWSISRNRFFGTPLPIWKSDNDKYPRIDVYGSTEELEKDFKTKITDLHRPFIDNLTRPNPDDPTGKSTMRRVEDVFDCWFESGSMPYGQIHYPFENKEWFKSNFPADFIVEYSAQTRGWFYTLMVLSTALMGKPPFLNCISHGVILDSTRQKLSKRLNNYTNPLEIFEQYGADATRVMMLSSNVVKGQELLMDPKGHDVFDKLRLFLKPIWHSYHFFCLYANIDKVRAEISYASGNILDQYILSKLKIAITEIECSLDKFDTQSAYNAILLFFDVLNNWYIRRSRDRFWKSDKDTDKISAYNTLYTCLVNMMKASSSLIPMLSEYIYLGLTKDSVDKEESVHLTYFPSLDEIVIDKDLVKRMDLVHCICSTALFIRNKENVRIRQPLSELQIICKDYENFVNLEDLIKEEVNVKSVKYSKELEEYANFKLVINFPVLGKRIPHRIKEIIRHVKNNNWMKQGNKLIIADIELLNEEYSLSLISKEKLKGIGVVENAENCLVLLDLEINEPLRKEGIARDFIRIIQQMRKEQNLSITSRIKLFIEGEHELVNVIHGAKDLINKQTLSIFVSSSLESGFTKVVFLDETEIKIQMLQI